MGSAGQRERSHLRADVEPHRSRREHIEAEILRLRGEILRLEGELGEDEEERDAARRRCEELEAELAAAAEAAEREDRAERAWEERRRPTRVDGKADQHETGTGEDGQAIILGDGEFSEVWRTAESNESTPPFASGAGEADDDATARLKGEAGEKIAGSYVLKDVIGRGRNGAVWLAYDERRGRDIVLKPSRGGTDHIAIKRLRDQVRALDSLIPRHGADHSGVRGLQGGRVLPVPVAARLLAGRGVTVHAALPGPVDTDMIRDWDIPKTSPESVARAILDGAENGEEEIFPDPMSAAIAGSWRGGSAKALERQNAGLLQAMSGTA